MSESADNQQEQSMEVLATKHRIDLSALRDASWYIGRNTTRFSPGVEAGLASIAIGQSEIKHELVAMRKQLDLLTWVLEEGFTAMLERLDRISGQLSQITQILRYPQRNQGAEYRERGIYLAGKHKFQQAVLALKQAIQHDETDFVSFFTLGYLFASNGQLAPAVAAFSECVDYADKNQAMRAEAAILAASCRTKLGTPETAWKVLHGALDSKCPDLALPLMRYAESKEQQDFAVLQLANSFIIDATLMVSADEQELDGVEQAAKYAGKIVSEQDKRLLEIWAKLYAVGGKANCIRTRTAPAEPKMTGNPRTDLANLVIYRRRLQMSIEHMRHELEDALAVKEDDYIIPPLQPKFRPWAAVRSLIGVGSLALIPDSFAHNDIGGVGILAILGLGLLAIDIRYWRSYAPGMLNYAEKSKRYERELKVQVSNHLLLEANRKNIITAMNEASNTLIATIPPAVPRAFAGDLVAYTGR